MKKHDFFNLMGAVKESLARDYDRTRARSRDDPGTAGDQAEEDWAAIFRNWFPANYTVIFVRCLGWHQQLVGRIRRRRNPPLQPETMVDYAALIRPTKEKFVTGAVARATLASNGWRGIPS
jgi:hypothetical protein